MSYRYRISFSKEDAERLDELKEISPFYSTNTDFAVFALREFLNRYQTTVKEFGDSKESYREFGEALRKKYTGFEISETRLVTVNDIMDYTLDLISHTLNIQKSTLICIAIRSFLNSEYDCLNRLSDNLGKIDEIFPRDAAGWELGPEWA